MNRLFRVLHRWKCRNVAQSLALDGLRCLDNDASPAAGLFLWHVEHYFRGLDAPEVEFRDTTNHVYYPAEDWGGAVRLARKWYWKTVEALRSRDWTTAAYAAGVLARYATFALSPPRTSPQDELIVLRRPIDWCLGRHYDGWLPDLAAARPVTVPNGDDWLERLLTRGAEAAAQQCPLLVEQFRLDEGIPGTFDDDLRQTFATQLAQSAVILGAILSRAVAESETEPPRYPIAIAGLLAIPSLPLFWLTKFTAGQSERRAAAAMARRYCREGIDAALNDDEHQLRDAYHQRNAARDAVETKSDAITADRRQAHQPDPFPAAVEPMTRPDSTTADSKRTDSTTAATPLTRRASEALKGLHESLPFRTRSSTAAETSSIFDRRSPIAMAPSVTPSLATRLTALRIETIGDLLTADSEQLAASMHPHATAADIATWQDEARLCCAIGGLRPVESQLLVACGVTGPEDVAALSPVELWELVVPVAESPDGRRLLRGEPAPDLDAVSRWIDAAGRAREAA